MASWFNVIGFAMLFLGLFLNEFVCLNIWYGSNLSLIAVALAYLGTAVWLSLRTGSSNPDAP